MILLSNQHGKRIKMTEDTGIKNTIGWAIKELHNGSKVCRAGWNGKNMYLKLQVPDTNSKMTLPYVYMKTADNNLVPWLCSQTDILATDWQIAITGE